MTLTEFLLARIAEDECLADVVPVVRFSDAPPRIESHSPARVRAECDAKRLIAEDYEVYTRDYREAPSEFAAGRRHAALLAATRIAAIYADHPDYRDEWKP